MAETRIEAVQSVEAAVHGPRRQPPQINDFFSMKFQNFQTTKNKALVSNKSSVNPGIKNGYSISRDNPEIEKLGEKENDIDSAHIFKNGIYIFGLN